MNQIEESDLDHRYFPIRILNKIKFFFFIRAFLLITNQIRFLQNVLPTVKKKKRFCFDWVVPVNFRELYQIFAIISKCLVKTCMYKFLLRTIHVWVLGYNPTCCVCCLLNAHLKWTVDTGYSGMFLIVRI